MNEFEQLIDDINAMQLAKAHKTDANGEEDGNDKCDDDYAKDDTDNDGDGKPEKGKNRALHKSLAELPDDAEFIDADDLIKAFNDRLDQQEQTAQSQREDLLKALSSLFTLAKTQHQTIAELQEQVDVLAKSGSGRRSVLASRAAPDDNATLLAKAELKMRQGALTGRDFQKLDVAIRNQLPVEPALKAKVLA